MQPVKLVMSIWQMEQADGLKLLLFVLAEQYFMLCAPIQRCLEEQNLQKIKNTAEIFEWRRRYSTNADEIIETAPPNLSECHVAG